jgi:hypothetical protein
MHTLEHGAVPWHIARRALQALGCAALVLPLAVVTKLALMQAFRTAAVPKPALMSLL